MNKTIDALLNSVFIGKFIHIPGHDIKDRSTA